LTTGTGKGAFNLFIGL